MDPIRAARTVDVVTPPRFARRASYVVQAVAALFLAFDAAMKLVPTQEAIEGSAALGWGPETLPALGGIALACIVLYSIPRTAVLGALLWTGFLGGAVATHVRVASPLLTHTLFPVYAALLVWGALWLRDERIRALLPLRAPAERRESAY